MSLFELIFPLFCLLVTLLGIYNKNCVKKLNFLTPVRQFYHKFFVTEISNTLCIKLAVDFISGYYNPDMETFRQNL